MKYPIAFSIFLLYLLSCNTENNLIQPKINKSKSYNTNNNWQSLNYPIKDKNSSKVFNITTNSINDLFASDNSNNLYIKSHKDSYWRLIKKYYNFISFIYLSPSDDIFIGINSSEGMYGSSVETPNASGNAWETVYASQNDINNLKMYHDTLYLAKYGGIAISGNNGKDWQTLSNHLEEKNVMDFVVNKRTGNFFIGTWSNGVLKSLDKGKTWKPSGFESGSFFPLLALNNGYVFAAANNLYRTKDDGNTWEALTKQLAEAEILSITYTSKEFIVVGTRKNGIFLSKDYGDSWENIGLNNVAILSLHTDLENYIYAGTDSFGILKSNKQFKD